MVEKVIFEQIYVEREIKAPKIIVHEKYRVRPSWIRLEKPPQGTKFLKIKVGKKNERYFAYLTKDLFLPISYTKNEMNDYPKILDIGAGTGFATELLVSEGFQNIKLLDFSKDMINRAKAKKSLKNCKFVVKDFMKYSPREKYDMIVSFFSFGELAYFSEEETEEGLKKIRNMLKRNGLFAIQGHIDVELFKKYFTPICYGSYSIDRKRKKYTRYFIAKK